MSNNKQSMGDMQFNGTPEEWEALVKKNKMTKNKKQTAVEWLVEQFEKYYVFRDLKNTIVYQQAKAMEKEQIGYTKQDVLTAGEMGEINTYDTKHIVSYLDEAKQFNETYGGNK